MSSKNNSGRVIKNTIFLYANMIVNICVQLIAVRLILHGLGETDYGIYNVIAGIVTLFAFMNSAMSVATQRFLSFEIGRGGDVREVFYTSVVLHTLIGMIVVAALEIAGIYYIDNILCVPAERLDTTKILLHCITASTFVNIITVPYESDINANEDMGAIAVINSIDSLMKLCTAIIICHVNSDRLIVFGVLTMTTLIITLVTKRLYCLYHYKESHFKWHMIRDTRMMGKMASFASWNFIGAGCSAARYHGTGIILNLFFGIIINASYGIAQQINGLLNFLSVTVVRAIRPQINKSAGANNISRTLTLSETTCKITALMIALFAIPIYVELPFILSVWLGDLPDNNCLLFCRGFLVIAFVNQLTSGLRIAVESVGKIRLMQSVLGTMHLLSLPAGYICLSHGLPAASIIGCIIIEEAIGIFARTMITHRYTNISVSHVLLSNVTPVVMTAAAVLIFCQLTTGWMAEGWVRLFIVCATSTALTCSIAYSLILTAEERRHIKAFITRK